MENKTWERVGASSGVVAVALAVGGYLAVGARPPTVDTSLQQALAYYTQHRTGLLWQAYLSGLAAATFLWFAGSLRHSLWKAEGDTGRVANIAFGGAIATAAIFIVTLLFSSTIAYILPRLTANPASAPLAASTVVQLGIISQFALTMLAFPAAVFIAATSVVILRNKALPSSIGIFGIPVAIATLVGGGMYRSTGAAVPAGSLNQGLFLLFLAWTLAVSVATVMQIGTVAEPKTIYLDQPQRERLGAQEVHEAKAG